MVCAHTKVHVSRADIPPDALQGTYRNTILVASCLTRFYDRVSICGIPSRKCEGLIDILLPLGPHDSSIVAECLLQLSQKPRQESQDNENTTNRLESAISEAEIFLAEFSNNNNNNASMEIFIVSASDYIPLPLRKQHLGTRFHTVSPTKSLGLKRLSGQENGWHIPASFVPDQSTEEVVCLENMMQSVIHHSRLRLNSGVLNNLSLRISHPTARVCTAEIEGPAQCKTLRPGETWTIPVNVECVSTAHRRRSIKKAAMVTDRNGDSNLHNAGHHSQQITPEAGNVIDSLINECYQKLSVDRNNKRKISGFSLTLTYENSQLSNTTSITPIQMRSEKACQVVLPDWLS